MLGGEGMIEMMEAISVRTTLPSNDHISHTSFPRGMPLLCTVHHLLHWYLRLCLVFALKLAAIVTALSLQ